MDPSVTATAPNVIPLIPGEAESAPPKTVRHYQDRKLTDTALCGEDKGDTGFARSWKRVNCDACKAAKRAPGRPVETSKNAPPGTKKGVEKPLLAVAVDVETTVSVTDGIEKLVKSIALDPICYRLRKPPVASEAVEGLGTALVATADYYGMAGQVSHPLFALGMVLSSITVAIWASPTIEDPEELSKLYAEANNPT